MSFLVRAPGNNGMTNDGVVRPQNVCQKIDRIVRFSTYEIAEFTTRVFDDLPLQNRERLFAAENDLQFGHSNHRNVYPGDFVAFNRHALHERH